MDLDGDGFEDILTGQYHPGIVTWFRGSERGFRAGITVDQWGDETASDNGASGAGENSFSYWIYTTPTFGDLDGDGDLDMIVGGGHGIRFSENIGTKTIPLFARREPLLTRDGEPLRVRDHSQEEIDRVANAEPSDWSFPELQPAGDFKTQPQLVDWDRDGVLDLLVGDSNARSDSKGISFFRGNGDGTYQQGVPLMRLASGEGKWLPGDGPRLRVTDWNEDGTPDLLIGLGVPYMDGEFDPEIAWEYSSDLKLQSPGKAPGRWDEEQRQRTLEMLDENPEMADFVGDPEHWGLNYIGHVFVFLGEETGQRATPVEVGMIGRESAPQAEQEPVADDHEQVVTEAVEEGTTRRGQSVKDSAVEWHLEFEAEPTQGSEVELAVVAKIDPTWHIYRLDVAEGAVPTRLEIELPDGVTAVGEWRASAPNHPGAAPGYARRARFTRTLRIARDARLEDAEIAVFAEFQACDPNRCLPIAEIDVGIALAR